VQSNDLALQPNLLQEEPAIHWQCSVSHARHAEGNGKYSALVDLVELHPRFCQLILQLFFDACDVGLLLPRFGGNGRSNRCM
jgi:hypothetical protein